MACILFLLHSSFSTSSNPRTASYGPRAKFSLGSFCQWSYIRTWWHTFLCALPLGVFTLWCHFWVVTKETIWGSVTAKPEIFIIWTCSEEVCRSLIVQLSIFPREKAKARERKWPPQGHLNMCGRDGAALIPALCLSLLDGDKMKEVVACLWVGSASTS